MKLIQNTLKISLLSSVIALLAGCESTSKKSTDDSVAPALGDTSAQTNAAAASTEELIPALVVEAPEPVVEKPKPVVVEKPKPVVVEKPKAVVVEKPKPVVKKPAPKKAAPSKVKLTKFAQSRLDEMNRVCNLSDDQYGALAKLYSKRTQALRGVSNRDARLEINREYYQLFMAELTTSQRQVFQAHKRK